MEQILTNGYEEMLLKFIPTLDYFPHKSGGEGVVYFLDDNFVVKEYVGINLTTDASYRQFFYEIFDLYCKEIKKYAETGFSVPKIYSWFKLPNFDNSNYENDYDYRYFILEERVKGRPLYYGLLDDIYPLCKSFCSKKEFYNAVEEPNANLALAHDIVKEYIADYISVNEYISSMPENVLAKMISDLYNMSLDGKFSIPDIYPSNILININNFRIIDNSIEKKDNTNQEVTNKFLKWLIELFHYNEYISKPRKNKLLADVDDSEYLKHKKHINKNIKECKKAIIRFLTVLNVYCDKPMVTSMNVLVEIYDQLLGLMPKEDANDCLKLINTSFQM